MPAHEPTLGGPGTTRWRPSLVPPRDDLTAGRCGGQCSCHDCAGAGQGEATAAQRPSSVPAVPAGGTTVAGRPEVPDDPQSPSLLAGRPLDAGLRADMETRFGHDFSRVRVHDDAAAGEAAAAQGASAFTRGRNIFFGKGSYVPGEPDGRLLIAHELAHVVQQSTATGPTDSPGRTTGPGDATEVEAHGAAAAVMRRAPPQVRSRISGEAVTQRQPRPGGARAPASMSIANVSGPTARNCSSFLWQVNFTLPTASPAGGYFVQEMNVRRTATDCAGAAQPAKSFSYHFWEAWHVRPGGTQDELVAAGTFNYADQFSEPDAGAGTKGTFSFSGSVAFYEGLALPATFVASNPATIAGGQPSTATNPRLSGGTPALAHTISGSWSCCPGATPSTIGAHTP